MEAIGLETTTPHGLICTWRWWWFQLSAQTAVCCRPRVNNTLLVAHGLFRQVLVHPWHPCHADVRHHPCGRRYLRLQRQDYGGAVPTVRGGCCVTPSRKHVFCLHACCVWVLRLILMVVFVPFAAAGCNLVLSIPSAGTTTPSICPGRCVHGLCACDCV